MDKNEIVDTAAKACFENENKLNGNLNNYLFNNVVITIKNIKPIFISYKSTTGCLKSVVYCISLPTPYIDKQYAIFLYQS